MLKIEVIDSKDQRWVQLIKQAFRFDFYHTSIYHQLDNQLESKLFCVTLNGVFIALPIVIRNIEGTVYKDFTSVYGYPGPIFSVDYSQLSKEHIDAFCDSFLKYCAENNIVTGFMRLHPLLNQIELMEKLGYVTHLNQTVSIDLTMTVVEQRKQFRKSLKSELNQLRRKGFYVTIAESRDEIDQFIDIYYETMDRVEATSNYYFSKEYFYEFLDSTEFTTKLVLARFEDQIIAGAIFTITGQIMQYHLAGTTEPYIKETPMKLILDEARLLGTELGLSDLHLGGGVGGHDDDSLFRFKSGFSKNFKQFSIWKCVFDDHIYEALLKDKGLDRDSSSFFPLYRKES